jgi:UDPglucose 6-dehydrogenase
LQYVAAAATSIAKSMTAPLILINKSTVPIGTGDWVSDIVKGAQPKPIDFSVVSCPEFLREGSAIGDFMNPHRTVIGSMDRDAANKVAHLHLPLRAPIVITDLRTAEMIKYASNAFLATKISFMNEVADLCEKVGADVKEVAAGMGYDARIGRHFLDAGLGWGGSCFPKDVEALAFMAKENGLDPQILNAVMDVNYERRTVAVRRTEEMAGGSLKGKTVGLLGLAFKPNTDDMRDAPSIDIAKELIEAGAKVRGYDPVAMEVARPIMPAVELCADPYTLAKDCDALIVVTEWNEFKQLDLEKLKGLLKAPVIYDGRNIYDPGHMRASGFTYRAIGRGFNGK